MGWLWDFLVYSIPWWVWLWVALLAIGLFLVWARSVGGIKNALMIAGGVALAVTAGLLTLKGRQQGARDQQQKEQRNADKTLDAAHKARARARDDLADPSRLRDDDGFRRDD